MTGKTLSVFDTNDLCLIMPHDQIHPSLSRLEGIVTLRHDDEFWHIKAKITDQRLNPKSPSYIKVDGYEDIYGKEFEGIYYVFKTDCVFNNVKQFLKYKNYTDDLFNRK